MQFQIFGKVLQALFKYDLKSALHIKYVFGLEKTKNVLRGVGFSCDGNQARIFQIGLEKCLTGTFQICFGKRLQIIGVFGLKKHNLFSAALVLVVMENKHALSKLDLKSALQAFFKYDLESAYK